MKYLPADEEVEVAVGLKTLGASVGVKNKNTNCMGGKGLDLMKGVMPSRNQMKIRPMEHESI